MLLTLLMLSAAAPEPRVYRLTPDQIAAATAAPAYDPLFDRSLFDTDRATRDRRVRGEIGAFVGSGGARGVFGTAGIPLGDSGFGQFSFEHSDFGRRRR